MPPESMHAPVFASVDQDVDVSIIIVNYNTAHLLERCVGNLRASLGGMRAALIVVDNASRDGSAAFIRQRFPDVHLIANDSNVGFGRANNQAVAFCRGRHVLLLNADAFVRPDTLGCSVNYLDTHPECGVLGVTSVDESGRELFSGRVFPTPWRSFLLQTGLMLNRLPPAMNARTRPVRDGAVDSDWVVGCYYMVRSELIAAIGLFDPRYFLYFEEVDHCRAAHQAGWAVRCLVNTSVVHVGGASAESEGQLGRDRQISALQMESGLLFARKHGGWSGIVQALGLHLLCNALLGARDLLKRRELASLAQRWRSSVEATRLTIRTRAGSRPTR